MSGKCTGAAQRMAQIVGVAVIAAAIRQADVPRMLSRISYYDTVECYEYMRNNTHADAPMLSTHAICRIVPEKYIAVFVLLCDIATGIALDSLSYTVLCSFLCADTTSIVNMVVSVYDRVVVQRIEREKTYKSKKGVYRENRSISSSVISAIWHTPSSTQSILRIALHILLDVLLAEYTGAMHKPGINTYWYINMQMIEQYRAMHAVIFFSTHVMLFCLSHLSHSMCTRVFLTMVFREGGYKGYMLLWYMIYKEKSSAHKKHMLNMLAGISMTMYMMENIVWCMLVVYGIGNMNFLCWSTLLFILASGSAVLIVEIEKRKAHKKIAKQKAE